MNTIRAVLVAVCLFAMSAFANGIPTQISVPGSDINTYEEIDNYPGCPAATCNYDTASSITYIGSDTKGQIGIIGQEPVSVVAASSGCYIGNGCVTPNVAVNAHVAPEPGSSSLIGTGLIGLYYLLRKRRFA